MSQIRSINAPMGLHSNLSLGLLLGASAVSLVSYSSTYLTEIQAVKSFFPSEDLKKITLTLTPAEIKKIEELSGEKVRSVSPVIWTSAKNDKNVVFIDQVLGKHEFITYAVGVSSQKKITGIEILEYRESYGQQVADLSWRKQFLGKDPSSSLKLRQDIVNISGATLSSAHITAGVKRILQTYDAIRSRL